MVQVVERADGVLMALGALQRPTDPREQKYALRSSLPPREVDTSQLRVLAHVQPIRNQGGIGACAAFAGETAAAIAREQAGVDIPPALHGGWLYYHARQKHGWEQDDTGSYPADNLDLLMDGAPLAASFPYIESALWSPPSSLEAEARYDYVLSHRPFYPAEGRVIETVWSALDAGMPLVAASFWPGEWFTPVDGLLPAGIPVRPGFGGHAWVIFGCVPGYFLAQNSWGEGWSATAAACPVLPAGVTLRPGQFAVPWEYADNGMIWEYRAVALEPVPAPPPRPQTRVYLQFWIPKGDRWDVVPLETDLPADGAWVTVKTKREGESEQVVIPFTRVCDGGEGQP